MITKSIVPLTNRQRMSAYRDRLDQYLANAPAEAEIVPKAEYRVVFGQSFATTGIVQFLRKGGAA